MPLDMHIVRQGAALHMVAVQKCSYRDWEHKATGRLGQGRRMHIPVLLVE